MSTLSLSQKCIPCMGNIAPLTEAAIAELLAQIDGWVIEEGNCIVKTFKFRNYKTTIAFVNRVAAIAEVEGHHPVLYVSWGEVEVYLWTTAYSCLTEWDFILAAKIDQGELDFQAATAAGRAETAVTPD
jgi:4a-hydroxytetrahydrobiopterin dehydratase